MYAKKGTLYCQMFCLLLTLSIKVEVQMEYI